MEIDRRPVVIRKVWSHNLEYEFSVISKVVHRYRFITMDTEFPGVVYSPTGNASASPQDIYSLMKKNVDALRLIQVGLTFSDAAGNLPDLGSGARFIWEFNFCGFDAARDLHAPDSIALLRRQGHDLERSRVQGVDPHRFAAVMLASGILFNPSVAWVTFHGAYDFGYLIKTLTGLPLPVRLEDFLDLLRNLFGRHVYDVKYMMRFCNNLYGGLEQLSKTLRVERIVGKSHQAGPDSLLTWLAFHRMTKLYAADLQPKAVAGMLYGLGK